MTAATLYKLIRKEAASYTGKAVSADLFALAQFSLVVLSTFFSFYAISPKHQILLSFLFFFCFFALLAIELDLAPDRDLSFYVFIPLLISATQNIYLGIAAPEIEPVQVQVMLVMNVLAAACVITVLLMRQPRVFLQKTFFNTVVLASLLALYGLATLVLFGGSMKSAVGSLRNIIGPFIFFLLGLIAVRRVSKDRLLFLIAALGWAIIAFGLFERFMYADMWTEALNVAELWEKKGLKNISEWGFPENFYSSEKIGGHQVRRMVSSYADPVNFGTVIFLVFMSAWVSGRKWLLAACVAATAATISKGAFMGILIFVTVWAFYNTKRSTFYFTAASVFLTGVAFVVYSLLNSTLSMVIHVLGFLAAFKEFPSYPLGRGLGNVGVLAGQFAESTEASEIKESGLGMIIGQLGIAGLLVYVVFFWGLFRKLVELPVRERVFALSLLFAILLNITFNEVALSPNSSGGYFLLLGLFCRYASDMPGGGERCPS